MLMLQELPPRIINIIWQHCHENDILSLLHTCSFIRSILLQDNHLWSTLIHRRYTCCNTTHSLTNNQDTFQNLYLPSLYFTARKHEKLDSFNDRNSYKKRKNKTDIDTELKIGILGDCGVGKSSTTVMFIENIFIEEYDPTIEMTYRKIVNINSQNVSVELLDCAGPEEFRILHETIICNSEIIIFMFDLVFHSSVDVAISEMNKFEDLIHQKKLSNQTCVVLVGNKTDLIDSSNHESVQLARGASAANEEISAILKKI